MSSIAESDGRANPPFFASPLVGTTADYIVVYPPPELSSCLLPWLVGIELICDSTAGVAAAFFLLVEAAAGGASDDTTPLGMLLGA
jgi:uncharacterized membrane protein HdeD (DUF308 family)